jgi:hypothetical protein
VEVRVLSTAPATHHQSRRSVPEQGQLGCPAWLRRWAARRALRSSNAWNGTRPSEFTKANRGWVHAALSNHLIDDTLYSDPVFLHLRDDDEACRYADRFLATIIRQIADKPCEAFVTDHKGAAVRCAVPDR